MYIVNKEVMYTLLHIDSQQVFAGLVFNNIIDTHRSASDSAVTHQLSVLIFDRLTQV